MHSPLHHLKYKRKFALRSWSLVTVLGIFSEILSFFANAFCVTKLQNEKATKQLSSRMLTARLLTVSVSVAITRCQYRWDMWPGSMSRGGEAKGKKVRCRYPGPMSGGEGGTLPCDLSYDALRTHSEQTDARENITFPKLCLRAVINKDFGSPSFSTLPNRCSLVSNFKKCFLMACWCKNIHHLCKNKWS